MKISSRTQQESFSDIIQAAVRRVNDDYEITFDLTKATLSLPVLDNIDIETMNRYRMMIRCAIIGAGYTPISVDFALTPVGMILYVLGFRVNGEHKTVSFEL